MILPKSLVPAAALFITCCFTRLQFETDMKALGYSPKQITKMWNTITPTSPAAKKTGAATAALLNSADDL